MKRTLIGFDDETYRRLRQYAFRHERSIASVVREMVAKSLHARTPRPGRASQFASVRAGRSKQGRLAPVSERHDEALAETAER